VKLASDNYTRLRLQLIERGITLRQFAQVNGLPLSSVYAAANGSRCGIKAAAIRRKIENYLAQ
jgi:predicted transcriptional regulator